MITDHEYYHELIPLNNHKMVRLKKIQEAAAILGVNIDALEEWCDANMPDPRQG